MVVQARRGDATVGEIEARHGNKPNRLSRCKTEANDGLLDVFDVGGSAPRGQAEADRTALRADRRTGRGAHS